MASEYKARCHELFPYATAFQPPTMNHTMENNDDDAEEEDEKTTPNSNDASPISNDISPTSNDIELSCNSTGDNWGLISLLPGFFKYFQEVREREDAFGVASVGASVEFWWHCTPRPDGQALQSFEVLNDAMQF